MGILQYVQEYDEKFSLTSVNDAAISESNPLGWIDAIFPYTKSHQILRCPSQEKSGVRNGSDMQPSDRDYSDYFYNRQLAGIEEEKIKNAARSILLGEGNDGTDAANARYSLSTLPKAWIADKDSPSYRHFDGANYAFADGHVKWMHPEKVTNEKPTHGIYTFAVI